ncbi:MAG: DUF2339 domain-containing protein [Syntrophales bacterium]|jgi:hypothetical protein|nr:DUF2339 domain-containing protein [Syntrophales bacterium]
MNDRLSSLESTVEQVAKRLDELVLKVDALSKMVDLYGSLPVNTDATSPDDSLPDASEAMLSWVGRSSLLQRLSTMCFLLVIALILRTVTDSRVIDLPFGSLIGMSYAAILMFMGWRRYKRENQLAPVFTVCGTLLMFTIIVEAHAHFGILSSVSSYIMLILTGLGAATISYVYRVPAPIAIGNLGMCVSAAAIDYPSPYFPYLVIVLLTANLLGYFTARAHRYVWLRWILLLVTLFMITLWGIKLGMALRGDEGITRTLAQTWFLPLLTIFSSTYVITSLMGIIRTLPDKLNRFELVLPTINVVWAFALAQYVVSATGGGILILGALGAAVGFGHLAVAPWLANWDQKGAHGSNAFVFAGSLLLALALPVIADNTLLYLPVLAAVAFWTSVMSAKWGSGSARLTSYLLQIYASITIATALLSGGKPNSFLINVVSTAGIACLGLLQYRWLRNTTPPEESAFFSKIDKGDFSAVTVLLAALLSAFVLLRVILQKVTVTFFVPADVSNIIQGSQSVIINISAIVLMSIALANRSRELRNVAILLTTVGAINVFLYDLVLGYGIPLVLSVLSFGLATAVESVILKRWQRLPTPGRS